MKVLTAPLSFLLCFLPRQVSPLPNGFIAEVVTSTQAVTGIFAPNPRKNGKPMLLLISKEGQVKVLENPDESQDSETILDLRGQLCTETERGLHSITVHPDFESNPFVYLFYTKFKEGCLADDSEIGPWNVLVRFEMNAETLFLDFESREELWRGAPTQDAVHNGGGLLFGNDGKIYLMTGDSGTQDNAQDLRTVHGSIIRLNNDGSTPEDNPYTKDNGYDAYDCKLSEGKVPSDVTSEEAVCAEIYANGLRNPFRAATDPNEKEKVRFAISDVGARVWEELSYGGTDYSGKNYGYKTWEGPCKRHSDSDCPVPDQPDFVDPFHYYLHREDEDGCVSGSAFVPEGVWPEEYKFLFSDYVFHEVYTLIEDPENECRTCSPPVSRFRNETFYISNRDPSDSKNQAKIVDIFFGPYKDTQALYIVRFGTYDTVIRIRYTGVDNSPPIVNFHFDESRNYNVGDAVKFDGSGSSDPEGNPISYKWFFGDGGESDEMSPIHVYEQEGEFTVTLFVEDSFGQKQEMSMLVSVGEPPKATIISPREGDQFSVGQVLTVVGEAFHKNGTKFEDSELVWEVRKHHDDHYHPYLDPTNGNRFPLSPGPKPEDFYASTNSYLEIILSAKDPVTGLTGKAVRLVQPMLVTVGIDSFPPEMIVRVDDEPVTAYQTIVSWKNHELDLMADDQPPFMFLSWSDGHLEPKHSITLNYTETAITAVFCAELNGPCLVDLGCCNGFCFQGSCVDDLPNTTFTAGPTHSPSKLTSNPTFTSMSPSEVSATSEPTSRNNEGNSSNNIAIPSEDTTTNIDAGMSTTAIVLLVVVVCVVVAGAGVFLLKLHATSKKSLPSGAANSSALDGETHMKFMDEVSPLADCTYQDNVVLENSSTGSRPKGGSVITEKTVPTV